MFVIVIGFCFLFILAYFTYEAAKENGYSSFFWVTTTVFAFAGAYLLFFLIFVFVVGVGMSMRGWTSDTLLGIGELIHLFLIALSAGCTAPVLWRVNKKQVQAAFIPPPPPPNFEQ